MKYLIYKVDSIPSGFRVQDKNKKVANQIVGGFETFKWGQYTYRAVKLDSKEGAWQIASGNDIATFELTDELVQVWLNGYEPILKKIEDQYTKMGIFDYEMESLDGQIWDACSDLGIDDSYINGVFDMEEHTTRLFQYAEKVVENMKEKFFYEKI